MGGDNTVDFGEDIPQGNYNSQVNIGHYVTFINLNDKKWLVLDCDKF